MMEKKNEDLKITVVKDEKSVPVVKQAKRSYCIN